MLYCFSKKVKNLLNFIDHMNKIMNHMFKVL